MFFVKRRRSARIGMNIIWRLSRAPQKLSLMWLTLLYRNFEPVINARRAGALHAAYQRTRLCSGIYLETWIFQCTSMKNDTIFINCSASDYEAFLMHYIFQLQLVSLSFTLRLGEFSVIFSYVRVSIILQGYNHLSFLV